jgi:protoporphyrin/coproporphyrin ferrochelatase
MIGVVVMAYGTPTTPEQILPYYTDIRRGRPPSDEQLADLTRRYQAIGGLSPLAERTEAQRAAIERELHAMAPGGFEVLLGLKHAAPTIEAAVAGLAEAGVERVIGLVLAPHYSAFSVGQYLDRMRAAAEQLAIASDGVTSWAIEPALVDFLTADLRQTLAGMPGRTRVVFTAHSLPTRIIDAGDPYPVELRSTAEAVANALGLPDDRWEIAWQSAGRTPEPWLMPDILEVIDRLAADQAVEGVVVCACGFVSDHLEVLYDLDLEARQRAERQHMAFSRTACVNDDRIVMGALARRVHALATTDVA